METLIRTAASPAQFTIQSQRWGTSNRPIVTERPFNMSVVDMLIYKNNTLEVFCSGKSETYSYTPYHKDSLDLHLDLFLSGNMDRIPQDTTILVRMPSSIDRSGKLTINGNTYQLADEYALPVYWAHREKTERIYTYARSNELSKGGRVQYQCDGKRVPVRDDQPVAKETTVEGGDLDRLPREVTRVKNLTKFSLLVNTPYSTPSCGATDSYWLDPQGAMWRKAAGGPRDFSRWGIIPVEQAKGTGYHVFHYDEEHDELLLSVE